MTQTAPLALMSEIASPTRGTSVKQLYFTAFLLTVTLLIALSRPAVVASGQYLLALSVLGLATGLAVGIRWEKHPAGWAALVPLLDIAAVGLVRDLLRNEAIAMSLLVVIPVLWLAARLQARGVALAVLATTAAITVPSLLRAETVDTLTIAVAALLPLTMLQVGLLTVGGLRVMDGQNRELTSALTEVEESLGQAAAAKQLLTSVIDSVDVGIVVVDVDGNDALWNRAQHRIHALATPPDVEDPDEARLRICFPGTNRPVPPAQRPVRRAVLGETFSNYVVTLGAPGAQASYSTSARQILDHQGDRSGAVVVFADVTSHIETVRSQERFVAGVSHELRTPLTSVIGYLDLAREDDLPEEADALLGVALRNAEQLLHIVEDLLADQVTRSGTQELELRTHRLSEIACDSAASFRLEAAKAGVSFVQDFEPTPALPLDAPRLRQAVDNLLSNAVKYTPAGGTVTVRTSVQDGHAQLEVSDTGIGMSMQEQANLFTEYYRTATARGSTIAGHGIGLALARRIVVALGGQISVRSAPGEGSTFTLRFALDSFEAADGP